MPKTTGMGRDVLTRFQPGNRANPGGRAKWIDEVRRAAKAKTPAALERLYSIGMNLSGDVPHSVQVTAISHWLDRVLGKPKEGIEISGPDDAPIELVDYSGLTEAELLTALELQRKARAAVQQDTDYE